MTSKVSVDSAILAEENDGMPSPGLETVCQVSEKKTVLSISDHISLARAWAHQIRRAGKAIPSSHSLLRKSLRYILHLCMEGAMEC